MKSGGKKLSQKRILLVEDDEPTRESAIFKFEKAGLKVDFAEDGRAGLEKLYKAGPFDLVLLDLRMPKSDGFWFLSWKKDDPTIKDIPVIVFTNLGQQEFVKHTTDLGAIGYLVKAHHSLDEIVEEVKRCLKGEKSHVDY